MTPARSRERSELRLSAVISNQRTLTSAPLRLLPLRRGASPPSNAATRLPICPFAGSFYASWPSVHGWLPVGVSRRLPGLDGKSRAQVALVSFRSSLDQRARQASEIVRDGFRGKTVLHAWEQRGLVEFKDFLASPMRRVVYDYGSILSY